MVICMRCPVFYVPIILSLGLLVACSGDEGEGPIVPPPPAPAEYAEKHMPASWWGDAQKLEEGRSGGIGRSQKLGKLLGQFVVPLFASPPCR